MTLTLKAIEWFDSKPRFTWRWFAAVIISVLWLLPPWWDNLRFWVRPVAVMQGTVVAATEDGVHISIKGKKIRDVECVFVPNGVQAFGDRVVGLPIDLFINRVDRPSLNQTKPKGEYDIGIWHVRPTASVVKVRVYVLHDCEGTKRATLIANVEPKAEL